MGNRETTATRACCPVVLVVSGKAVSGSGESSVSNEGVPRIQHLHTLHLQLIISSEGIY